MRREFIRLLLQQGQRARALSQALVYAAELSDAPERQLEAARLLLDVGDPRRALDRYTAVLASQPRNLDALSGAGEAAFALGEYARARRFLTLAQPDDQRLVAIRRVADLVLSANPLAPRLGRAERERRLQAILQHASDRLAACAAVTTEFATLTSELAGMRSPPRATSHGVADREPDGRYEDGIELAVRAERMTSACGPADEWGRAVVIIARIRGLEETR